MTYFLRFTNATANEDPTAAATAVRILVNVGDDQKDENVGSLLGAEWE